MTELTNSILVSVILNLIKDGGADYSALSPVVQEYLIGIWEDFDASEEDEKEHMYWFAHTYLSEVVQESKGLLH